MKTLTVKYKPEIDALPSVFTLSMCPKCGTFSFVDFDLSPVCPYCAAEEERVELKPYQPTDDQAYHFTGCGWERK
uniref:Uncharacterized protein n=1 Tax=viral metagenome TaxID=1070528 RepID=A0A6H1ZAC6_9ZZZZ